MHGNKAYPVIENRDIIFCFDGTGNDDITDTEGTASTNPEIMTAYLATPDTAKDATRRVQDVLYMKGVGTKDIHPHPLDTVNQALGLAFGVGQWSIHKHMAVTSAYI